MKLEIMQVEAGKQNHFLIFSSGKLRYQMDYNGGAGFPFSTPDSHLVLKDAENRVVYQAKCTYGQQLEDQRNFISGFLGGADKINKYQILTSEGAQVSAFYEVHRNLEEARLCIEYNGKVLTGMRKIIFHDEYMSFYDGNIQVGQLTKKGFSLRRRDAFIVHFVPGFEELESLMAFFAVFYDYKYHNVATAVPGERSSGLSNVGQNGYNPNFITQHFGANEKNNMEAFFKAASQGVVPYPYDPLVNSDVPTASNGQNDTNDQSKTNSGTESSDTLKWIVLILGGLFMLFQVAVFGMVAIVIVIRLLQTFL